VSIAGEPKRHVLDVYGDGFAFEVTEPPGWFVDSTIASEFGADVILYPTVPAGAKGRQLAHEP